MLTVSKCELTNNKLLLNKIKYTHYKGRIWCCFIIRSLYFKLKGKNIYVTCVNKKKTYPNEITLTQVERFNYLDSIFATDVTSNILLGILST